MSQQRTCRVCSSDTDLEKNHNLCRSCNTQYYRQYRQSAEGKAAQAAAIRRYEAQHPERRQAWTAARKVQLRPCEVCGSTANVHRHHDDPAKKLEVMFLCALHHKQRHAELRAEVAA